MLVRGLGARYVLVGDDFRFGARRAGDYAMLDAAGQAQGFDVARMKSYEVHGLRVCSSAVRDALAAGNMELAASLLGRPYSISGHVLHGRKLGRELGRTAADRDDGFARSTCASRTRAPPRRASIVVRVHGLADERRCPAWPAWACGRRWTTRAACCSRCIASTGRAALGPEGGYGNSPRVELLHKLRDEVRYDGLPALTAAIRQDVADARAFLAAHAAQRRQTTRDRI